MKIEKINENQIRCTLTQADLEARKIHLSELAYGTEKARNLFRDMMQQANFEFGFEADNIPLMIEAIPASPDSIILIITKVEDPEELDTRFSKFAPSGDSAVEDENTIEYEGADDIIDVFQKIQEAKAKALSLKKNAKTEASDSSDTPVNLIRSYYFQNLDLVIDAARSLNQYFTGRNSLYKDFKNGGYDLVIHQSGRTPQEFNKVCNVLSEYGNGKRFTSASEAYLMEHSECMIAKDALQKLAVL